MTLAVALGTGSAGTSARARAGLDASEAARVPSARVLGRYTLPSGGEEPAHLTGLAAANGTVWVTGTQGPIGKDGTPTGLVLRYQGGRLARLDAPLARGRSEGGDVAATGDRAWVLASDQNASPLLSTDGRTWRRDDRPSHGGLGAYGIAATGDRDVWIEAAGSGAGGAKEVPALLHYDGTSWHRKDRGVGGDRRLGLFGITARASDDVWVAGERSLGGANQNATPFLAHWDGRAWRREGTPVRLGFVRSVAPLSGTDVWAAGGTGCSCSSAAGPLVLHYDGRSWRRAAATGLRRALASVVQDGHGGLWAADDGGRVVHFDGHRWRAAALPGKAAATAVARDPRTGRVYAIADEPEQNAKVTTVLLTLS
ncbi:hypothetical protein EBO15_38640 [Actinomadura harenae]|uniref:Exo-alpha-sialidase n=1 Tax=Actinomadura harenae TaxID=2483351 RepID=A0A3M2LG47_9ACTN|nr:hypothetical protein EBO15_38640 [Actinomadura harenae]